MEPLSKEDLDDIRQRRITPDQVLSQVNRFAKGFPFAKLVRPCTAGDGITLLDEADRDRMGRAHSEAALDGRVMKFVPASGAASRMFKSLLSVRTRLSQTAVGSAASARLEQDPEGKAALRFINELKDFAFYEDLRRIMAENGLDLCNLDEERRTAAVLEYVLGPKGLNLSNLPKGLIPFHVYPDHTRTPFEEHLVEAALYVRDRQGRTRLHFTVSPEHRSMVADHLEKVRRRYEKGGVHFEITLSIQEPATDTVAVGSDNELFRDRRGRLVFRPGGHGALLGNLNALQGDIVFIKNIDNVAPDRLKEEAVVYKKALGGFLVSLQKRVFDYLKRLRADHEDSTLLGEVLAFLKGSLSVEPTDDLKQRSPGEIREFLQERLNRPLRVCGMVKNEGEPGGGPYWVRGVDGSLSIQIVESSQVNMDDNSQGIVWRSATHFNPVDLVCGVRDYLGKPFDLTHYMDPDTGFISIKSKDGKELKALELPGLWNGGMARWNTAFVEVPSATFTPVKTMLDLLRSERRPTKNVGG